MKPSTGIAIALGGLVAFVGYKAVQTGAKTAKDVAAAAKKVLTEDLNPASDKNLAYRATNAIGNVIVPPLSAGTTPDGRMADGSFNLGQWFLDKLHPETKAAIAALSNPSDVKQQAATIAENQANFRAQEIAQQNADAQAEQQKADAIMSTSRSDFRVSEHYADQGASAGTDSEAFRMNLIVNASTGYALDNLGAMP